MAQQFVKSVEDGLKLAKRIYFGNDRSVSPPRPVAMEKSSHTLLPTSPMLYAVISDPAIVDNPDIPSYQPHVHGRCDPPALIPLQMNAISVEVDCYLDTAFVTVNGSWRVHCVKGSRSCDCRLAIPMSEQGSILGVEVDVIRRSYCTRLITTEEKEDTAKAAKVKDGGFLKPQIFTMTIPEVDGGFNLSVKASWSQKLSCKNGQFSFTLPFSFPEYVTPVGKKLPKREKIHLSVNAGTGKEVLCKSSSHPLQEIRHQAGKLGFSYEADVLSWSSTDFMFSYEVCSIEICGSFLSQSPSVHDFDQREMFCLYLFSGNNQSTKVFRKEVVFIVDISGSMRGGTLESVKNGLYASLSKFSPEDSFSIIAFNKDMYFFSSSLEKATKETIENAFQWISINFVAGGDTNILPPLDQAIKMFSNTSGSIPLVFLITDGSVEDERHICQVMKTSLTNRGSISPRICTFGIGAYCNHYFLQMLAVIGRGLYDAAYDVDSIELRLQKLVTSASSAVLANITIEGLAHLDALEVYPYHFQDLLSGTPLTIYGRYQGNFPDIVKLRGTLSDMRSFVMDLKVQNAKDIPLDKVFAKRHIDLLTAQAWLSENKTLEEKVAKMSLQTGVPSEYTHMILLQTDKVKQTPEPIKTREELGEIDLAKLVDSKGCKIYSLPSLGTSFGNLTATQENIPPGSGEAYSLESAETFVKATSGCCGKLVHACCCMCGIRACSRLNNECSIILTQICTAISCFACSDCCADVCSGNE
ncbi:PREDICTED: inter alpha-trypsin inhibitor, heavy chain 4-like [Nelumbo nucifera]|uniref:Inter alpha-trypsin inhibitor, heavy chain 4-like n=1 Tax=Nelumbo nucifera TaxID=4432 RepID=A0A1U8A3W1_NELNU|nr:PREDICTED: inter alpha-trypsin inhibitor, heavy chain 4-like [Nelumbo nucifera]